MSEPINKLPENCHYTSQLWQKIHQDKK